MKFTSRSEIETVSVGGVDPLYALRTVSLTDIEVAFETGLRDLVKRSRLRDALNHELLSVAITHLEFQDDGQTLTLSVVAHSMPPSSGRL